MSEERTIEIAERRILAFIKQHHTEIFAKYVGF